MGLVAISISSEGHDMSVFLEVAVNIHYWLI